MNRIGRALGLLLLLSSPHSRGESAVEGLIGRFAPAHASGFRVESIPATDGRDTYEVETTGGVVILRGNSGVAQASAFYHYLKEFCHAHVSWNGDNLALPAQLPSVPAKIRVVSPVVHRMAYNYCTHGYTMPFWNEAQWDRELDWLALHGINRILIIEGQEAVWQNTFTRFGHSAEEMRKWLCSPVHQPWQFMQNMEGVLPPPQSLIEARARVGRYLVGRCKALGIEPVLQGYYGMVPTGFAARHPEARVFPQGGWAGGNRRPDMLDPGDPLFQPIAKAFMEEQRKVYGDCLYLAADPFHEGGSSKGMDRGTVYKRIQEAMLDFDPRITLVKQCWQTSNKEMFDAGNKERSLALDLNCDYRPFWRKANGYDGTPWTWCFLYNFGGNLALEGDPVKLAADFGDTLRDPGRGRLEGTALVPEGSQTNPLMYELMTEMAWRGAPENVAAWVNSYLQARYGERNPSAEKAWSRILATAYRTPPAESPINSIITGRPRLDPTLRGRTWSPGSRVSYDNRKLAEAWSNLAAAAGGLGTRDGYRYDLADVGRQVLTNHTRTVFDQLLAAARARDVAAFRKQKDQLLGLIADLDELTGTRREWLMGAWVGDARRWGTNPDEVAYMDRIARMILTTWVENPQTDLADYANREWNGLLGEYYLPRWKRFLEAEEKALVDGHDLDQAKFDRERGAAEVAWIRSAGPTMAAKPVGDTLEVTRRLIRKYIPAIEAAEDTPRIELDQPRWNKASFANGNPTRFSIAVPAGCAAGRKLNVGFAYRSGANALRIESVSLEVNGRKVAVDEHEGWTGVENRDTRYSLDLPASAPRTSLRIVAKVQAMAGTDSQGEILLSSE